MNITHLDPLPWSKRAPCASLLSPCPVSVRVPVSRSSCYIPLCVIVRTPSANSWFPAFSFAISTSCGGRTSPGPPPRTVGGIPGTMKLRNIHINWKKSKHHPRTAAPVRLPRMVGQTLEEPGGSGTLVIPTHEWPQRSLKSSGRGYRPCRGHSRGFRNPMMVS